MQKHLGGIIVVHVSHDLFAATAALRRSLCAEFTASLLAKCSRASRGDSFTREVSRWNVLCRCTSYRLRRRRCCCRSVTALRSARNASRVRGAVNKPPCVEGSAERRRPINGASPKTSSAGLALLLLLAKKERLTPADRSLASSLRRARGRRSR